MSKVVDNNKEKRSFYGSFYGRVYPAIILILFGIIFLLNNFGVLPDNAIVKLWPVFMIIPGIFMLLRRRK